MKTRTLSIFALLLAAFATAHATEGKVTSVQGEFLHIRLQSGPTPAIGDTANVMNFPDANGNATAVGMWKVSEVNGRHVTAIRVRSFGGTPAAGMEVIFRSSPRSGAHEGASVEVPGARSSGAPGKVTEVRGDAVTIRLESPASPVKGDRVEISYAVGEDTIALGTWRVTDVRPGGRVDADPEDIRGQPTPRMDALVFATGAESDFTPPQTPARRPEGERELEEAKRIMAKDPARAVELLVKAAQMGHAEAAERAALAYEAGQGVPRDDARAAALFRQAAEAGRPVAQNYYGSFLGTGRGGLAKDEYAAVSWYQRAAAGGNGWAQSNLCHRYIYGIGVEKNYAEALRLCQLSVAQNNPGGLDNLGWIYQQGLGVQKDLYEAVSLYLRAADLGHANGQNNVGYMYRMGWGVEQDYQKAIFWFRKSSDQGKAHASFNLAQMYDQGLGVQPDRATAIQLYRKAVREGHEGARERLRELGVN
jgi:TPR repeat protein